MSTYIFEKTVF